MAMTREDYRQRALAQWADPEKRARTIAGIRKAQRRPEARRNHSIATRAWLDKNPDHLKKMWKGRDRWNRDPANAEAMIRVGYQHMENLKGGSHVHSR